MRVSLQKSKNFHFLYIVKDFYSNGKRTTKIVEKLGTVTALMQEKNLSYDEVIAWAKDKAKTMTENEKKKKTISSFPSMLLNYFLWMNSVHSIVDIFSYNHCSIK